MGRADEFGFIGNGGMGMGMRPGSAGTGAQYRPGTAGSTNIAPNVRPGTTGSMATGAVAGLGQPITNDPNDYGFGAGFGSGAGAGAGSANSRQRPRAGTLPGQGNRLTIVNAVDDEIPEESSQGQGGRSQGQGQGQGQQGQGQGRGSSRTWLSAEDEKAKLYQQAKAEVERVQGGGAVERTSTPPVCSSSPTLYFIVLLRLSVIDCTTATCDSPSPETISEAGASLAHRRRGESSSLQRSPEERTYSARSRTRRHTQQPTPQQRL